MVRHKFLLVVVMMFLESSCSRTWLYYTAPRDLGRELDASCNKLEALPPEIGKCCRLRKLRANGNYMEAIPTEVGHCALLEVCTTYGERDEKTQRTVSTICGSDSALRHSQVSAKKHLLFIYVPTVRLSVYTKHNVGRNAVSDWCYGI